LRWWFDQTYHLEARKDFTRSGAYTAHEWEMAKGLHAFIYSGDINPLQTLLTKLQDGVPFGTDDLYQTFETRFLAEAGLEVPHTPADASQQQSPTYPPPPSSRGRGRRGGFPQPFQRNPPYQTPSHPMPPPFPPPGPATGWPPPPPPPPGGSYYQPFADASTIASSPPLQSVTFGAPPDGSRSSVRQQGLRFNHAHWYPAALKDRWPEIRRRKEFRLGPLAAAAGYEHHRQCIPPELIQGMPPGKEACGHYCLFARCPNRDCPNYHPPDNIQLSAATASQFHDAIKRLQLAAETLPDRPLPPNRSGG
jgi:hypothetical protein